MVQEGGLAIVKGWIAIRFEEPVARLIKTGFATLHGEKPVIFLIILALPTGRVEVFIDLIESGDAFLGVQPSRTHLATDLRNSFIISF